MIVNKGLLPKRRHGLETSNIYVLIIYNKLDIYNIVIEITDITSKKREIKLDINTKYIHRIKTERI
ncbi:MAG TPA: hypothetical protein VFZ46_04080 [Nitrososphaeraceae archaeon]